MIERVIKQLVRHEAARDSACVSECVCAEYKKDGLRVEIDRKCDIFFTPGCSDVP